MSDTFTVQRSALIGATPAELYPHIADFRNWTAWSPWEDADPDLRRTYGGSPSGTGATYTWAGNRKVGEGRMEITEAVEPAGITIALEFLKPFKSTNTTRFQLTPEGDGTRVTWTMTGPKTWMTKLMGLFKSMDAVIGPDFEKGLNRLKGGAEGRTR